MRRIAIVGGGITGLSAAFAIEQQRQRASAQVEYVLLEAGPRFGGVLKTEIVDGCQVEAGPDSFLTEKPWASDLCVELGLGDQLIGSNDADRKTYILVNGRLVVLPDGLMFMVPTRVLPTVFSPLFSLGTKLRMAAEWFHPPHRVNGDESVAALVERHYGREMVDRLADPLLSGVYGGEAAYLSVRAVLPRFAEMEAKHGSLGRAMLAARRKAGGAKAAPRPLFTSLKNGMQQMADAITSRLTPSFLRTATRIEMVRSIHDGWLVSTGAQADHYDSVILATPAPVSAQLLRESSPQLADELSGIAYTSSITVNLGYGREVRKALPPGFGFLVPRSEAKRMLACTFVHNKFPHRAPEDRALLRCFIGGARNEGMLSVTDGATISAIREELQQVLGLADQPLFSRVYRWKRAMAQYGIGHLERLDRIAQLRAQLPGLYLAGNAYRGIGVPDCVRSGADAAGSCLSALGMGLPARR